MRSLNSPAMRFLPLTGLCLMLSSCIDGFSLQKTAGPVSYAEVEKNMKGAVGMKVIWIGKELESKTTSDLQHKTVEETGTYLLQPSASVGDLKWFVVDYLTAKRTDAAKQLDQAQIVLRSKRPEPGNQYSTSVDPELRKISGKISKLLTITVHVNGSQRQAEVPSISNATVDAPDTSTKH